MRKRNLLGLVLSVSLFLLGCINKREDAAKAEPPTEKSHRKNSASRLASGRQISEPELLTNGRIRTLLQKGEFQELNTLLESCQQAFERDVKNEDTVDNAFAAFEVAHQAFENPLHDWIKAFPNSYSAYLARAVYYSKLGWESRGYKWASKTRPAQFARMKEYFASATQDANTALRLNPQLVVAYQKLIEMGKAMGDDQANALLIEKALDVCPGCFHVRQAYIVSLEPRWGGSYEAMAEFAQEALAFADLNPRLKILKGFIYWDAGRMASSNDQDDLALEAYEKALGCGEYWVFHYDMGRSYDRLQRYAEALEHFSRSLALRPQAVEAYVMRASIYGQEENFEAALRDIQTARQVDPYDQNIQKIATHMARKLVYDGHDLYKANQFARAHEKFDLATQFDSSHAETYYWRGQTYIRQNQMAEALLAFQKSIDLNPRHFDSYRSLDWVLARRGDWDAIIAYWTQFLELEPNHAKAYLERGGSYYHKGDLNSALLDARKACDLGEQEACEKYHSLKARVP